MRSLVKEYMAQNKVLVAYVRDVYGFKTGVVVALSPTQLGFSLVKRSEDVEWKRMKPWQLPAVQRMVNLEMAMEDVVASKPYQKCIQADNAVKVPRFDKRLGLMYAIDSALNGEVTYNPETKEFKTAMEVVGWDASTKTPIFKSVLPSGADFKATLISLADRASRAKW